MRVLITQSNYLPWRGYFAAMRLADRTVLLESVQYTRRDWRNRNRIRAPEGPPGWLTVPVESKGRFTQLISETKIADSGWVARHRGALEAAYRRSACWTDVTRVIEIVEEAAANTMSLSELNQLILDAVRAEIGIGGVCHADRLPSAGESPSSRLVRIAGEHGATTYLTGPSARSYLDEKRFLDAGIAVEYLDYRTLPPDPEGVWDGGELSIVDLIARAGFAGAGRLARFEGGP